MVKPKRIFQRLARLEAIRQAMLRPQPPGVMASLEAGRLPKGLFSECYVKDCHGKTYGSGLCENHYDRFARHGNTEKKKPWYDRSGNKNSKWRGGILHENGRILLYVPNHPRPNHSGGKHVFRARLVMEQTLGRYLTEDEIVHHKNRDKTDDRPENLEVMTQSQHARLHNPEMQKARWPKSVIP